MAKKDKLLVSIIVPVYNVERYVDECLESIVNQTYTNLEIILVNDATPDSSGRRCDDWAKKDKRIRVVHKQKNEGLFLARITGFDIMNGDYFVTVDSDDCIDSDYIEKLLNKASSSNADIVISESFKRLYSDGRTEEFRFPHLYTQKEVLDGLIKNIVQSQDKFGWNVWGKMYKKGLYNESKAYLSSVNEHISAGEDILYSIVFAHYTKTAVYLRNYAGYSYRENDQSIMHDTQHESFVDKIDSVTTVMYSVQRFLESVSSSSSNRRKMDIFKKYLIGDSIWAIKNQYITVNEELRQEIGKNLECIAELQQQVSDLISSKEYRIGQRIRAPYIRLRNLLSYLVKDRRNNE